ncbi:MAG TPA: response regulator transcription factor [Thermoanaerobaculia bacterium]|nr:response regulator transcription factor [Thermoanaerobaculia bacterium]
MADDQPVVREGLVSIINRQPDMAVVAAATDGRQAIELFRAVRPDVAVIELRLPVVDGPHAIRVILAEHPASRIVVLTRHDGDADIRSALEAGARGYLLKSMGPGELIQAMRSVLAGHRWIAPAAAVRLSEHIGETALTKREIEVLRLVVEGRSNKRLAAALGITEGTVKAHINRILSKMQVGDRTEAATQAIRRGIVYLD